MFDCEEIIDVVYGLDEYVKLVFLFLIENIKYFMDKVEIYD